MQGLRRTHFTRKFGGAHYHSPWITAPGLTDYECRLSNLSQSGAELVIVIGNDQRSRFQLIRKHNCEVIWWQGKTIGVKFTLTISRGRWSRAEVRNVGLFKQWGMAQC